MQLIDDVNHRIIALNSGEIKQGVNKVAEAFSKLIGEKALASGITSGI